MIFLTGLFILKLYLSRNKFNSKIKFKFSLNIKLLIPVLN